MDKLEELKKEINKEIKAQKKAEKGFSKMNLYISALDCQTRVSAFNQVLVMIAEIEGDTNFF